MLLIFGVFVGGCVVNCAKYSVKGYIIKTLLIFLIFTQHVLYFTRVLQIYQAFKNVKTQISAGTSIRPKMQEPVTFNKTSNGKFSENKTLTKISEFTVLFCYVCVLICVLVYLPHSAGVDL